MTDKKILTELIEKLKNVPKYYVNTFEACECCGVGHEFERDDKHGDYIMRSDIDAIIEYTEILTKQNT